MRMMMKVTFPVEVGNRAIKDGSLAKIVEATLGKLKPEAVYFAADHGVRGMMAFFDLKDASDVPVISEPLFMGLDATVDLVPVMNRDDLMKGLTAAMQNL